MIKKNMLFILLFSSITMKYVDDAIKRLDNTGNESQYSVLQKLLKIDRHYAVLIALDMLFAGIDTVSKKCLPYHL